MQGNKDTSRRNGRLRLRFYQAVLLVLLFVAWYALTSPTLLPPIYFAEPNQAAFFFGEPLKVFERLWRWFATGEIYEHLWVTLVETLLAFLIGTVFGVVIGLWLALAPAASAILDPYIKAINAMPRVILAPIFFVWFGLDIASKVALGVTLVFFIVFFNVYQGVSEVSPVVLANARMLGATPRQLLRHVYVAALSLLQGIGFGLIFTPLSTAAFSFLPQAMRADATGLYALLRHVGGSVGVATLAIFLFQRSVPQAQFLAAYHFDFLLLLAVSLAMGAAVTLIRTDRTEAVRRVDPDAQPTGEHPGP